MEDKVLMSQEELRRARLLEHVVQGELSLREVAVALQVSYRHAKRLRKRYLQGGPASLVHGNRGRPVAHALSPDLAGRVVALHERTYSGFNDTHFTEMLLKRENIRMSRESVRRILRQAGKAPKHKRRAPRHRARRPRKPIRGIMVQWDGSPHHWFGSDQPPCCLLTAIDDADSRLLAAVFISHESAIGYLRLLDMLLRLHGAPASIYQDRHTIHVRSDDYWSIEEEILGVRFPTHVGRVLRELGIEAIPAYSPQAKGRIERGFGVLQDRLIAELDLQGITDMQQANRWLESDYIPGHNNRFARTPEKKGSAFRRVSARERYRKVAFAYEATVANDNCVRLGGLTVDIPPGKNRRSYARARVLVRQHLDGAWSVWYQDTKIASHPSTELKEPWRSWKRRRKGDPKGARYMTQVYLSSRPAPPPEGT
jgi:transposase